MQLFQIKILENHNLNYKNNLQDIFFASVITINTIIDKKIFKKQFCIIYK